MKRIIKILFESILYLFIIGILYLNYALYYQADFQDTDNSTYNKSVYHQLQFLKTAIQKGADTEMQYIFPEGFVFMNALYGLTWCDLIAKLDDSSPIYKEGIYEINQSLKKIDSPEGKEIFLEGLPLAYGAFYRGWSTYLLGQKLSIQEQNTRDSSEIKLFKQYCKEIAFTLNDSKTPYLASYQHQAWPADGVVLVASIALHDKIFDAVHKNTINDWLKKVKSKLDTSTGLIPHEVHPINGGTKESARGSSQSLMLSFLFDIDSTFAKEQFDLYIDLFADTRLGLPGIREYPKRHKGNGDVDSGPVIWGIGGSASIVGQRTMAKYGKWDLYKGLRNSIEGFGVGYTLGAKKQYIFGQLPMADAFIAWSNVMEHRKEQVHSTTWRMKFQLISLVMILVLGFLGRGKKYVR